MALSALLLLIVLSPLMRGGNRQVALLVLEAVGLAVLAGLAVSHSLRSGRGTRLLLLAFVVASPLWLALAYLVPLPPDLWSAAGRAEYRDLLARAGLPPREWLPLSLVPDATRASLLAGIPVAAAFCAGYLARVGQLRAIFSVLVIVAFAEVAFGLLQIAGGHGSVLYFGGYGGRPFGTFANANHYANYIAMALAAYTWLGWTRVMQSRRERDDGWVQGPLGRNAMIVWMAGGVVLVLGVLMSRSRGAALGGLPAGMLAFALAMTVCARSPRLRTVVLALAALLAAAMSLVGVELVVNRFELSGLASAASVRSMLAAATMEGAWHFWPWGAGWGTYAAVFPRFQPAGLVGYADYAHHDFAQMLFEGGVFALLLMAAFGWLFVQRAAVLVRAGLRQRALDRAQMAAAMCGLGLLGFLVHSLVEFNMHIPANAIAAALLAGVYLRPLQQGEEDAGD